MIFNEIKSHVKPSLGVVDASPASPHVSAPEH